MSVLPLKCSVKNYHWGSRGLNSAVAPFLKLDAEIDNSQPYAELWMGTHPSGQSIIRKTSSTDDDLVNKPLAEVLKEYPEYVGNCNVVKRFGTDLPFLFKILSVREPLSIQTHPDKSLAEKLHAEFPDKYPDSNHKPEMAIAISKFSALCSFRTHSDIQGNLESFPELKLVIGDDNMRNYISAADKQAQLKICFAALMNSTEDNVKTAIASITEKFEKSHKETTLRTAFEKLTAFYPNDVGCLTLFLLNYLELEPGEALYLAANEPHCYISGDCIECMAKSDNVIRAGLTPKFKDVSRLCASLTYSTKSPNEIIFRPAICNSVWLSYNTPASEFAVDALVLNDQTAREVTLPSKTSGSILLVLDGSFYIANQLIKAGSVYFIAAMITLPIRYAGVDVKCYRAYIP